MNILLLCIDYPPLASGRGVHADELARGLIALGHKVTVLAAGVPELRDAPLPSWVRLVPETSGVNPFTHFEDYRKPYSQKLYELASQLVAEGPFDLIHTHEWYSTEAAIRLANDWGIPGVATVHLVPPTPPDTWQPRLCQAADAVIAVSQSIRDLAINKYQLQPQKVHTVYNAVNKEIFARAMQRSDPLRRQYSSFLAKDSTKLVVLSGRIHPQKGIDLLLLSIPKVLEKMNDVRWVICGGGMIADQMLARYAPLIEPYQQFIVFTGHIPREDAVGWQLLADVVVAPSRYEPCGLSVLEAMVCGKPIIASNVDGMRELVVHEQTGIKLPIAHKTPEGAEVLPADLAQAQINLLLDNDLAHQLGRNAQQYVSLNFSYTQFIQHTIDVYTSVLR